MDRVRKYVALEALLSRACAVAGALAFGAARTVAPLAGRVTLVYRV